MSPSNSCLGQCHPYRLGSCYSASSGRNFVRCLATYAFHSINAADFERATHVYLWHYEVGLSYKPSFAWHMIRPPYATLSASVSLAKSKDRTHASNCNSISFVLRVLFLISLLLPRIVLWETTWGLARRCCSARHVSPRFYAEFLSHLNLLYLYIFRSIVLFVTQVWCTFISQLQHTTDILDFIALCFYIQTHPRLFITGEPWYRVVSKVFPSSSLPKPSRLSDVLRAAIVYNTDLDRGPLIEFFNSGKFVDSDPA